MRKKPVSRLPRAGARPPADGTQEKAPPAPALLERYLGRNGLPVTLGLVSLLIVVIFHDFLAGNVYYLFKDIGSDSINLGLSHSIFLSKYLRSEGFPAWSFAQGMGQNILPTTFDPFGWIVLLFGTKNVAYGFIWMEATKFLLTATFFFLFLGQLGLSTASKLVGTLLYTFSGFVVIGSGWGIFSDEACLFALLLLAFEKLYRAGSWYLFPVVVALITTIQPFDLYLYGLFLILYFHLRHFSSDEPSWRKYFTASLEMGGLLALGLLMSSFALASTAQMMLDSPRVGGSSSYSSKLLSYPVLGTEGPLHNVTAVLRFFSNDLLGNGSGFKGWGNYLEAPMVYIGLLPLLLFPQVFVFLQRRQRILYGIFLGLFFVPMVFPFFRYSLWLFSGDYYRGLSIFISITLLFFSVLVVNELDTVKRINIPVLAITLVSLVVLLYFPYDNIDHVIQKDIRSLALFFLVAYSSVIVFLSYIKNRDVAKIMLICLVMLEIGVTNSRSISDRVVLTRTETLHKTGFNDYSVEASAFTKSIDKGFFRVNKEYTSNPAEHASYNDAKVQDYFGTMSYFSFNQKYYIRFLEETGVITKGDEHQSRWATGLLTRPLLQIICSVKYNFTKQDSSQYLQFGYEEIAREGDVRILRNRYFLPLGFTYDRYIRLGQFRKLTDLQKQVVLYRAFVAEDDSALPGTFQEVTARDVPADYTLKELAADVAARQAATLQMTAFSNNRISGTIDLAGPRMLFFSIPYDRGWHCTSDGKPAQLVLCNTGFLGLPLEAGRHAVELSYSPPYLRPSLLASLAGVLAYAGLAGFVVARRALGARRQAPA